MTASVFLIRVWDIPTSDFVVSGKGPETAKNRKWVLTCCACYHIFSLYLSNEEVYILATFFQKKYFDKCG